MLVFRKWSLVLALVMLTAAVASADLNVPAFQCVANAGVPPIVRAEGIAELTGDLVLNCTGGLPAQFAHGPQTVGGPAGSVIGPLAVPQVNVQVFLNTNITSRIDASINTLAGSEALLMVDEPPSGQQVICAVGIVCPVQAPKPATPNLVYRGTGVSNVWQGQRSNVSSDNSLAWLGVPIDAPGTTFTRVIRITNIRANANQLGVSSTLVPTQIIAYISVTGVTSIPINNPQQTVAWIQPGMFFSVRTLSGGSGSVTLLQCASQASDLVNTPTTTDKYCYQGRLRFDEGFATAFKTIYDASVGPQNTPGAIYNISESGFSWPTATDTWGTLASWVGKAHQGTRLRVVFNNVPLGLKILVSTLNAPLVAGGVSDTISQAGNTAVLTTTDLYGGGSLSPTPYSGITGYTSTSSGTCTGTSTSPGWDNQVPASPGTMLKSKFADLPIFGGTATAVWEVTSTDPLAVQRMEFGYLVSYSANTANGLPGLAEVKASGSFAPVSTTLKMSNFAPVPRFADATSSLTVFVINQCVTNLLFPFVTNQAGFDTGMVIANTTLDPLSTKLQSGTCKLNYYGNTNGGAAPPAQTSATIAAGEHMIWGLSSGGNFGIAATQGFQGYIIAQCKFQNAHGFAFISDYGNTKTAQGYLALVLDASGATRPDRGTSETLGM